jgi:16S rRNA (uracil1498-N3)-methyltransferase
VQQVVPFVGAVEATPRDALKLLFWEAARYQPLRPLLPATPPAAVVIGIGPEGGFTDEEVARAREAGFVTAGLGPRLLRTETAAVAALAVIGFVFGEPA